MLQYSIMKPLYKEGERNCISNYRPASLLISFSKVFKKVISKDNLKNNLDLTKNITTEEATYELINEIVSALNVKLIVEGIFL